MTMYANRVDPRSPNIKVGMTYGPISGTVEEHFSHLRHFWGELGRLLDEMEAEARAKVEEDA